MTRVNQGCKITSRTARFAIKHQYLNSPHKYFSAYSVSGTVGYNDTVNRTDLRGAKVESGVMRKLAIAIYREKDSEVNPERCGTTQRYFYT